MSHGQEYRTLREQYLSGDISVEDFLSEYREPDNYRAQDPGRNRSHVDEGP
ncbi:GH-E family nuclease [Mycobacterium sp. MS1601]|uniref:GH-E family nuclease n=1 Tax=Mycobacterium sp. MS1601 TaxID=1936029 RepID=UPI0009F9282C